VRLNALMTLGSANVVAPINAAMVMTTLAAVAQKKLQP
jgi:hypothetical protein